MAETVVVKESLSERMIVAGADLTRKLDKDEWPVTASFWLYLPELNRWRLFFASPRVDENGPIDAYARVFDALSAVPNDQVRIDLQDVAVAEVTHPTVALLRTAVHTEERISGIRMSRNAINGHWIEDAYIYRMT